MYQFSPEPVTAEPAPLRAARIVFLARVEMEELGTMG